MFLARVSGLIESRRITKNKLLLETGINTNAFNNWEKRGTVPSGEIVAKIADYFHVSTDYLLGRTDDPRPAGDEKEPTPVSEEPAGLSELGRIYRSLNDEGREKLLDYAIDLEASGRYIKSDPDKLGKEKNA